MQHFLARRTGILLSTAALCLLGACSTARLGAGVPGNVDEPLVKGPAMMDVVTPFDRALACLDGRINKEVLRFSVGSVIDATGKEQVTDGGSGKFLTQGAGDIVQSALFLAGASVVNRRDPRIIDNEVKWGLLDAKKQTLSTFFITGSINSLDFLPGSGYDVQIAGLGPRFRQNRILVGLDLSLTETRTGRILSNVSLQKQVVASEDGFGIGRFFGKSLVSLDIGGREREALNLVLRQMLNLATFELLTQVMSPAKYADCMQLIEAVDGVTDNSLSNRNLRKYLAEQARAAEVAAKTPPANGKKTEVLDEAARTSAVNVTPPATAGNPAPVVATAPTQPAPAAQSADADSAAAQRPYFSDEQTRTSPVALKAMNLPGNVRAPEGAAPSQGANGGVSPSGAAQGAGQAASAGSACVFNPDDFPQVTPLRAAGPGTSLRLRSRTDQVVCLADRSGRFTAQLLVAGVMQQFEGLAPWRLQAERMGELDIVFQGLPLRKPSYIKDRMELLERS